MRSPTDPVTPAPLTIRLATTQDTATVAAFNHAIARETEHRELAEETVLAGVRNFIEHPARGRYFVAESNGQVVGQTAITYEWSDWRNGEFWWLQSVYVLPEHRGAGVFKSLYHHIEQLARKTPDCCGIRLYMERDNAPARQAYRKLGMHETGYEVFETVF